MLTYGPDVQAQLDDGRIKYRDALRLDLDSGTIGFITGFRGATVQGGVKYVGSGGLIGIDTPEASVDAAGASISVTLASHYKINGAYHKLLDPHLLVSIENENWFNRQAVIYRFWFDANRRVIEQEQRHVRRIFSVEHKRGEVGSVIEAVLGAPSDYARVVEGKIAGPELQKLIDPTDTSARHVQTAETDKVYFGRLAPNQV